MTSKKDKRVDAQAIDNAQSNVNPESKRVDMMADDAILRDSQASGDTGQNQKKVNAKQLRTMGVVDKCDNEMTIDAQNTTGGDLHNDSARTIASQSSKRDADDIDAAVPNVSQKQLDGVCNDLQRYQRLRVAYLSSRIKIENEVISRVALTLGYDAGHDEESRKKAFDRARKAIKSILKSQKGDYPPGVVNFVVACYEPRAAFAQQIKDYEKEMEKLAKQTPVAEWVTEDEQKGASLLTVAKIVGEAGNLSNYANPAKLWKRMGCAPYNGKMGRTWARGGEGKLSAAEWTDYGYSPRRRAIMYVVSKSLIMGNDSVYRETYDKAKDTYQKLHPDYPPFRVDYHGHLLCAKEFLKRLWCAWNGKAVKK